MAKRILTSIIGLLVFFAVIFANNYVLYSAVTVLSILMVYEMYNVISAVRLLRIGGYISTILICVGFIFSHMLVAIYGAVMLFFALAVVLHGKISAKRIFSAGFCAIFISSFMSVLILMRKDCGIPAILLPFICAWLSDTGAYFAGTFFGKHKLCEHISPKKTVEGAIGGVILSTIGCVLFSLLPITKMAGYGVSGFVVVGLIGSVLSQLGDLGASCIKRDCGKKDYGTILPGHGGFMDRFDSVIFILPFVYYAVRFII